MTSTARAKFHRRVSNQNLHGKTKASALQQSRHVKQQTLESTRRMVKLFEESKDAGVGTLALLHQQDQQLDRVEDSLDSIHSDLVSSEQTLLQIENAETSCCLSCSCCVRCRRKHKEDNPALWQSVSYPNKSPQNLRKVSWYSDIQRFEFEDENRNSLSNTHDADTQNLRRKSEETENLDYTLKVVKEMKEIAQDIEVQLGQDEEQLSRINQKMKSNIRRLSNVNEKSGKLLFKLGKSTLGCC